MLEVDRSYRILRVEELASRHSKCEKHLILTIREGAREEYYVLQPIDVFAQNEIIMIYNKSMYMEVILRGTDPRGNPILVLSERYK
jgi:hypothetical protein